jgi:hypothetical protein
MMGKMYWDKMGWEEFGEDWWQNGDDGWWPMEVDNGRWVMYDGILTIYDV